MFDSGQPSVCRCDTPVWFVDRNPVMSEIGDFFHEFSVPNGFCQKAVGMVQVSLVDILGAVRGGEDYDRDAAQGLGFLDVSEYIESVDAREFDIEQDQSWGGMILFAEIVESFFAIVTYDEMVVVLVSASLFEGEHREFGMVGIIFDDQYGYVVHSTSDIEPVTPCKLHIMKNITYWRA